MYTVVLGAILLAFSTVLYVTVTYYLYTSVDTRLNIAARETISTIKEYYETAGNKPGALEFAVKKALFYHSDYPISLFDLRRVKRIETRWQERADALEIKNDYLVFVFADKQRTLRTLNVPTKVLPVFVEHAAITPSSVYFNMAMPHNSTRFLVVPFTDAVGQRHFLHVGVSQQSVEQLLMTLLRSFAVGIPLVLIVTSFVGNIFAKRILDPIEEIAYTANQISNKDLSLRVKSEHLDEEIEYLVASFNKMIIRLEKSFEHINEFSSRVAHELKTPLAIIKGECELILSKPRSQQEYIDALHINLEEADRMRKTVEDLLLLARLEYQVGVFNFQSIDFTEFFTEICEQTRILAVPKNLTVTVDIPSTTLMIYADKLHLRRVYFNIIDNAIKFTSAHGEIKLKAVRKDNTIIVFITDTGVGIAPENLPLVFDKFYHSDHGETANSPSTGLGLSIVQSIVKIHHGQAQVTSELSRGTTFMITLPLESGHPIHK